jgi:hypothetical protein
MRAEGEEKLFLHPFVGRDESPGITQKASANRKNLCKRTKNYSNTFQPIQPREERAMGMRRKA